METDADLRNSILAELQWDTQVDASDVAVSVRGGVVKLSGFVDSLAQALAAMEVTRRVSGIKDVENRVVIRPPAAERSDAAIGRAADDAIKRYAMRSRDRIAVAVENGWVTLRGDLDWDLQKESVEQVVRTLHGVKGVINLIAVRPKADPSRVRVGPTRRTRQPAPPPVSPQARRRLRFARWLYEHGWLNEGI